MNLDNIWRDSTHGTSNYFILVDDAGGDLMRFWFMVECPNGVIKSKLQWVEELKGEEYTDTRWHKDDLEGFKLMLKL